MDWSVRHRRETRIARLARACAVGALLASPASADDHPGSATGSSGSAGTAAGAPGSQELEREVRRLRGLEARYAQAENGVLAELQALSREGLQAETALQVIQARLEEGQAEAKALLELTQQLESRVAEGRLALHASLRRAYRSRSPDWLAALLAPGGAADLPRNLRYIGRLGARQSATLARFRSEKQDLEKTRTRLAASNRQLAELVLAHGARHADVQRSRRRKATLLADLERRKADVAVELRHAAAELARLFGGLRADAAAPAATGFAEKRGRLPWPVDAAVTRRFGVERHPRFHTLVEHSGIVLASALGTPVLAVHPGVVAYGDWFQGYGLLVILDHGDGYYTLYAHLGEIAVRPGERLQGGQAIGRAGDTGSLEGPRLYFEIRHGERALDPQGWLVAQRRR